MPTAEIAAKLGISKGAVCGARNCFGLEPRRVFDSPNWTAEKVSLLRKLWVNGVLIKEIAATLGIERHTVEYRARREKLERRRRTSPPRPVATPQKSTVVGETQIPAPARLDAPVPLQPAIWTELSSNWITPAEARSCSWPIGEPGTPGFHFCDAGAEPGRPYCAEHCRTAFVPKDERREHLRRIDRDASNGLARVEVEQWV
jgi:GcrA cell cycle regulator